MNAPGGKRSYDLAGKESEWHRGNHRMRKGKLSLLSLGILMTRVYRVGESESSHRGIPQTILNSPSRGLRCARSSSNPGTSARARGRNPARAQYVGLYAGKHARVSNSPRNALDSWDPGSCRDNFSCVSLCRFQSAGNVPVRRLP